jgi:hypothetical protein
VSGSGNVSLGTVSVELDRAGPRPSEDAGDFLWDWVMRGTGIGASGCAALGDATQPPGP